jgi:hypothetical protein
MIVQEIDDVLSNLKSWKSKRNQNNIINDLDYYPESLDEDVLPTLHQEYIEDQLSEVNHNQIFKDKIEEDYRRLAQCLKQSSIHVPDQSMVGSDVLRKLENKLESLRCNVSHSMH